MTSMDSIGTYKVQRFPKHRQLLGNLASLNPKHPMQVLLEVDVTRGHTRIHDYKEKTGETLSFTAWLIKCVAQTVSEYKEVQAYRKGRELIVFDDVDVGFTIERRGQQESKGKMVVGSMIRKANEKTLRQVNEEIRAAQAEETPHGAMVGEREEARIFGLLQSMPGALRRLAFWWYRRDPFLKKRTQGTVGVTSVGNVLGITSGMWGFPIAVGPYPLFFGVGGISRKPGVADGGGIEVREYLAMSVMFDHDAVDGAEAARFLGRLGELLKEGYGVVGEDATGHNRATISHVLLDSSGLPGRPYFR